MFFFSFSFLFHKHLTERSSILSINNLKKKNSMLSAFIYSQQVKLSTEESVKCARTKLGSPLFRGPFYLFMQSGLFYLILCISSFPIIGASG